MSSIDTPTTIAGHIAGIALTVCNTIRAQELEIFRLRNENGITDQEAELERKEMNNKVAGMLMEHLTLKAPDQPVLTPDQLALDQEIKRSLSQKATQMQAASQEEETTGFSAKQLATLRALFGAKGA